MVFAITVASLAQVIALEFKFPLWVILLDPTFLGETLIKLRLIKRIVGFSEFLIITVPLSKNLSVGFVAAGLSAIGFSNSVLLTKLLSKSKSTIHIVFYMPVIQNIFGFICSVCDRKVTVFSKSKIRLVAIISILGLLAQYWLTASLTLIPAAVVSPLEFVRLTIIVALGFLLCNKPIELSLIIGALFVSISNYINILPRAKS